MGISERAYSSMSSRLGQCIVQTGQHLGQQHCFFWRLLDITIFSTGGRRCCLWRQLSSWYLQQFYQNNLSSKYLLTFQPITFTGAHNKLI